MSNEIILINYWTSEHFEKNKWDKYYCKSKTSALRFLKEYTSHKKDSKFILAQAKKIYLESNVNIKSNWLYINISKENLI